MEKRFVYPAIFLGLGLVMLWTHLQMVADSRSMWVVGASISTGIFFYVVLVRSVPELEPTFDFPMDITTPRIWLTITASAAILGVALAFRQWPRNIGLEFLFALSDGLILATALRKAHGWAWPLGSVDIRDVIEDSRG